jgi:hypothetical protein
VCLKYLIVILWRRLIQKFNNSIDSLHQLKEFNGNILLAKNGVALYEKSIGFTDSKTNFFHNSMQDLGKKGFYGCIHIFWGGRK